MKNVVKPTSVRLDTDLLEELDQRCKKVGCSRNDFIKNSIELVMKNYTSFDFGNDEENHDQKLNSSIKSQDIIITDIDTKQEWIQDKDRILHKI